MVKLTSEYLKKIQKRSKNLSRTHLCANNRYINEIADEVYTNLCNVTVIYLHCNSLRSAGRLSVLAQLTHLYLQWNKITSVSDLQDLPNLTNLYLGHNFIEIFEGLYGVPKLKVLHVEDQKLSANVMTFSFRTETLIELSASLTELNVSGNNITSLTELQLLSRITRLDISNNLISNITDVCNTVQKLENLTFLKIEKNPITSNTRYEYEIMASSKNLEKINNRSVSSVNRNFMHMLKTIRIQQERQKKKHQTEEFRSETKSRLMST